MITPDLRVGDRIRLTGHPRIFHSIMGLSVVADSAYGCVATVSDVCICHSLRRMMIASQGPLPVAGPW